MPVNLQVTRSEVLTRKSQLELAEKGHELLEKKRAALLKELMETAGSVMEETSALRQAAEDAQKALGRAEAEAGYEEVRSAALAARSELSIRIESGDVMGVKVPRLHTQRATRSLLQRGYSITGTPVVIDEAAEAFEEELDAILRLAESELRLRRLASEIERTTRRLNALEHVLIPTLKNEIRIILNALEERERADHFRLKLAKRVIQRKDRRDNKCYE